MTNVLDKLTPPEPDLSSKPPDIIGYCFGYGCPEKHVQNTFESFKIEDYSAREVCFRCGEVAKPCVVKRTAEAKWGDWAARWTGEEPPEYGWAQFLTRPGFKTLWTRWEFFHYLEKEN